MPAAAERTDGADFAAAFRAEDARTRLRHAQVGCWLAMVLMPAGISLDLIVAPEHWANFFSLRLGCVAAVALVLALLATPFGLRHLRVLGVAWAQFPALAIAAMVWVGGGAESSYWAGLSLVLIAVTLLMPWTFGEVLANCVLTLGWYLAAILVQDQPMRLPVVFNNLYFLTLTAIICGTAAWFTADRRLTDFRLRWRVDAQNRELSDSYGKLRELDEARTRFFANISHELRTPLTLILAPVDDLLTSGRALPTGVGEALGMVRQNGLRLLKLINDLLEVVRVEVRPGQLFRERLDLRAVASGLVEVMRYLAEAKGLGLAVAGDDLPLPVDGDPARLEKVVLNLLTNAIKFTPAGGRITVSLAHVGDQAEMTVTDTGIGIPAEAMPRLFQRFQQVDGSSTRRWQGMGLGLALIKDLVEEHGGTITVTSTVGSGSSFCVRLPLASGVAPAPAAVAASDPLERIHRLAESRGGLVLEDAPAPLGAVLGEGAGRVLVVDDEPDMRRYLVGLLGRDHAVREAVDGPSALVVMRTAPPDLVVLDMMLPGLDGLGVLRAMRAETALAGVRVVMVTARVDDAVRLEALGMGADDFLTKPFISREVQARVGNHLRLRQLERQLAARVAALEEALTRLRSAEEQLVQTAKMNALGSMAAGLLHEINNPLNYTLTAAQFASESFAGKDALLKEVLDDITGGMRRISEIITGLRAFAHPDAAGLHHTFAVAEVLATALRFTSHGLQGVTVVQDLPPGLKAAGSASQISMVLVNLLSNAGKAIRVAGRPGRVTFTGRQAADDIVLTVEDDGVGMSPQHLQRACEPFWTTAEPGQGLGLGLALCHTIMRNHGGRLHLASQQGIGTTITITLPALPRAAPTVPDGAIP